MKSVCPDKILIADAFVQLSIARLREFSRSNAVEQRKAKKSDSIEVRLSYDKKRAFMDRAASEGRSASEVVRGSIDHYVEHGIAAHSRGRSLLSLGALVAVSAVLLTGSVASSPARADYKRAYEATRAALSLDRSSPEERRRLSKEYAKEFAPMRVLFLNGGRADRDAFVKLDSDGNRLLSFAEYHRLMNVPDGPAGSKLFQSQDRNRDGQLSEEEFISGPSK